MSSPPAFDPLLHHPARLKIVMLMAATTTSGFNELVRETEMTPGNLQSHLKALDAAQYVEVWRSLVELKPRMRYRLTDQGRSALRAYCAQLAAVVTRIDALGPGEAP